MISEHGAQTFHIGAGGTANTSLKLFWPQPMAPWTAGLFILLIFTSSVNT